MYTHKELLSVTNKQRQYEYRLMARKISPPTEETETKELKSLEVTMPPPRPQLSISLSQLMSIGYDTVRSRKTKPKVNSYA
jgi:hypothetical protein